MKISRLITTLELAFIVICLLSGNAHALEMVRVVSAPEVYLVPPSIVDGVGQPTVKIVKQVDLPPGTSRWLGIKWCHKLNVFAPGRVSMRITTGPDPDRDTIIGHHAFYTMGACPGTEWFPEGTTPIDGPLWIEFKFENYGGRPRPLVGTVWLYAD